MSNHATNAYVSHAHKPYSTTPSHIQGAPLPGLSVILVDRHSSSPAFHHYGVAHLDVKAPEQSIPIDYKTLFPIGASLAKNFTALVIAQLHCEGKVKLDEDIRTYLPDVKFKVCLLDNGNG